VVCIAENEIDLIAVPYWLAVVDFNRIGSDFLNFMRETIEEEEIEIDGIKEEIFISKLLTHTIPIQVPHWMSIRILINEDISVESLEGMFLKSMPD
jgi:hypothetical protein